MPRKKKSKWGTAGLVLSLLASIPMNLLTAWLQKDVVINALYLVLVILLLVALMYFGKKKRTSAFFNGVFWLLVITVTLNLVSTWIEESVIQDKFTLSNVTVFLSLSVIALSLSALLQSHFLRRWKQSMRMKYKWNAVNMRLASEYSENPERNMKVKKRLPRRKRRL